MADAGKDNLALNLSDENTGKGVTDENVIELKYLNISKNEAEEELPPEYELQGPESNGVGEGLVNNGMTNDDENDEEVQRSETDEEAQEVEETRRKEIDESVERSEGDGITQGTKGDETANGIAPGQILLEKQQQQHAEEDENLNHEPCDQEDWSGIKRWRNENLLVEEEPEENKQNGKTMSEAQKDQKASGFENAMFVSRYITFWWMQSLYSLGYKKVLETEDISGIFSKDKTEYISDRIERAWHKEAYDTDGKLKQNASLFKALFKAYGFRYLLQGIPLVFMEGIKLSQPIFLGYVTSYFAPNSTMTQRDAFLYGMGLALCSFIGSFLNPGVIFKRQSYGMKARIALSSLVYQKVLRLSSTALAGTTTGHIVNLVSVDVQKLDMASFFLHYIWAGPVVVIIITYLTWQEIGPSALAGMGLLIFLAPCQFVMSLFIMHFRRKALSFTDQRVKIVNQIITGIRVIKLYAWEEAFCKIVHALRVNEMKALRSLLFLRASFLAFFFSSGSLVSFITFATYVSVGNSLTAQKVFTCVAYFNMARLFFTLLFPFGITMMNECRVTMERIQAFLLMDELQAPGLEKPNLRPKQINIGVTVKNLTASWNEDATTLDDITLTVGCGQLTAIVGPVGSGKSSLLMAILGELPPESGIVNTVGKVAYVSQEAWIFNGSLRNNITFGQGFDEKRYKKVIEICALEKDIELLPEGDMTLVGERGVSLSGGQKARINLARAVYFDADIYIMDDPLSAVDTHVGRHLFDKCINGHLSSKVRILVTHQLQYLTDADEILVLDEGRTMAKGTFNSLRASGIDFIDLMDPEEDDEIESDLDEQTVHSRRFSTVANRKISMVANRKTSVVASRKTSVVAGRRSSLPGENEAQASGGRRKSSSFERPDIGSDMSLASNRSQVEDFEETKIEAENKFEGRVTLNTYLKYFRAGFGLGFWSLVVLLFVVCQGAFLMGDWWLSYWTTQEEKSGKALDRGKYLGIYAALVALLFGLGILKAVVFNVMILKSNNVLHGHMLDSVLRAPLRFFDTNSIGRILNRFSKDMNLMDDQFAFVFFDLLQMALVVVGVVLLVCATNPVVFAFAAPIMIIFFFVRQYHVTTAREIRRIEGLYRSPIFGHFSTTLLGLPVIRAFQVQQKFTDLHFQNQDDHTKCWTAFIGSSAWLGFRLELMTVLFTSFVVFVSIALRDKMSISSGEIGLMLAYTTSIVMYFQQCVKQSTEFENQMTSVERVVEYSELEPEAARHTEKRPPDDWPSKGAIRFDNMSFAHAVNLPFILKGITADIKPNEKVGICGRTGAGKSSLLSSLFRTAEPTGAIFIDDVNVLEIGLHDLRTKISIIPQDPVLFSGTLRQNLDPCENYTDLELWSSLEEVQLKEAVSALPKQLSSQMAESGQNFSVGQRQLVCLARAILKKNKILVIDEATANVDLVTDGLIQTTIREKFQDCTVLTIAHRLNTIMDSDRIMVLDAGSVKEFDEPYTLLRQRRSALHQLVAQTGKGEAQNLFDMARRAFEARRRKVSVLDRLVEDEGAEYNISIEVSDSKNNSEVANPNDFTLKVDVSNSADNTAL